MLHLIRLFYLNFWFKTINISNNPMNLIDMLNI
nr:MAG TPA: hypothetical protein [Inoviridae sp.]